MSFLESFGTTLTLKKFSLRWRPPQRRPRYFIIGRWGSYRGFAGNTFGLWWFFFEFFSNLPFLSISPLVLTGISYLWEAEACANRDHVGPWTIHASSFIRLSIHRRESELSPWHGRSKTKSGQKERHDVGSLSSSGRGEGWTFSRVERVYRGHRQLAEDRG